jgi:hypothetical protein
VQTHGHETPSGLSYAESELQQVNIADQQGESRPLKNQSTAGNAVIRNAPSPQTGLDIAISSRELFVAHPLEYIRECRSQPFDLLKGEGKLFLEPEALLG